MRNHRVHDLFHIFVVVEARGLSDIVSFDHTTTLVEIMWRSRDVIDLQGSPTLSAKPHSECKVYPDRPPSETILNDVPFQCNQRRGRSFMTYQTVFSKDEVSVHRLAHVLRAFRQRRIHVLARSLPHEAGGAGQQHRAHLLRHMGKMENVDGHQMRGDLWCTTVRERAGRRRSLGPAHFEEDV